MYEGVGLLEFLLDLVDALVQVPTDFFCLLNLLEDLCGDALGEGSIADFREGRHQGIFRLVSY